MKKLFTLALIFFSMHVFAQTDSLPANDNDYDKEFKKVDVEAKFPGGQQGWIKYLQKNLNADLGAEYLNPKKHKPVRQTVIVSFLVDKEGKITEVKVLNENEVHPKLAEEAIRVIKQGPDWIPAEQDGRKVIYRQKQSITWEASVQ